ncbi:response regulator transcription factor [Egibacter rhizosphaerae]|uniref:Response regulator transcription factor n=1 Tax=Egibacter rhizosphaerae TaxID=1670831 RepID=A0A411YEF5_9ACTN|nr:response regulator transcription factor [Egibacter rhizosphaerae]QBI19588.1 response regulator transcription factor [Egibacter rhizosphaerae]
MARVNDASVRVLLVDDDPLVRSGLRLILDGADDVRVVGEAADGDEVPDAVAASQPHVVLMDLRMPRVDGLAATERVRGRTGAPEVLVLTTFDADEHVLRALEGGASGFLLKDTPPEAIVDAIRTVAAGEAALSPSVARRLIAHVADDESAECRNDATARLARLTDREHEVALAVGQGSSNAEIADDLAMSVATVKANITRILAKLGVDNRVQVALLVHEARGR